MCSAKLSFKSFTIVLMEVSYRHSNALVFAGLYIVQVSLERLFDNLRRLHLQMWCWLFSLWFSMMCPINNVLLCFARASYFVQVSVMKMFKSSIEYALQNSVSIHSLLFWWNSPISAALLCFSLASYIFQVSMLKLPEFWKTKLANLMLNFSLWFSLMSPINNVLLCCSRASFSVSSFNHEIVEIFYRICSAKLSFKSLTIVLMEVSYRHGAALVFACFLYCSSSNIETLREFRMTTLANVMLIFFSGSDWCLL